MTRTAAATNEHLDQLLVEILGIEVAELADRCLPHDLAALVARHDVWCDAILDPWPVRPRIELLADDLVALTYDLTGDCCDGPRATRWRATYAASADARWTPVQHRPQPLPA